MNKPNRNRLIDLEKTGSCQRKRGIGALGERGEGTKKHKLAVIE